MKVKGREMIAPEFRIDLDQDGNMEFPMLCPIMGCGFEYTHLESVTCYQRPDGEDTQTIAYTIDGSGLADARPVDSNPSDRRDATVLHFSCEDGHFFDVEFVQHKGQTFTSITNVRDKTGIEDAA